MEHVIKVRCIMVLLLMFLPQSCILFRLDYERIKSKPKAISSTSNLKSNSANNQIAPKQEPSQAMAETSYESKQSRTDPNPWNSVLNRAELIAVGYDVVRTLISKDDVNWFRFDIPSSGCIGIEFIGSDGKDQNSLASSDEFAWRFGLYDENGQSLDDSNGFVCKETEFFTTGCYGVSLGTYYVKVENAEKRMHISRPYTFNITYNAADDWEKEPNNSSDKATRIEFDQRVRGALTTDSDLDCYAFSIFESSAIRIAFDHDEPLKHSPYWGYGVYDLTDNRIAFGNVGGDEKIHTSEMIDLEAGTYFIKVNKGSSHSSAGYVLSVSEHKRKNDFRLDFKKYEKNAGL